MFPSVEDLEATPPVGLAAFAGECARAGFDLIAPLCVGWYNDAVAEQHRAADFGDPASLALLIGNSRALWEPFIADLAREPSHLALRDPLSRYVERVIERAAARLHAATRIHHGHDPARVIAMQRVAELSGLSALSPSHLSVHPRYGPWIGLRSLVVVRAAGPACRPQPPQLPCGGCEGQCLPAFRRALASSPGALDRGSVKRHFQRWLAARDACPWGREFRYGEAQIRYHYLEDRGVLESEVARWLRAEAGG